MMTSDFSNETMDMPDVPDVPEMPEVPETPEVPEMPDTPETPAPVEAPEPPVPGTQPETPAAPENKVDKPSDNVPPPEQIGEQTPVEAGNDNPDENSPEGKQDDKVQDQNAGEQEKGKNEVLKPDDEVQPDEILPNSSYERNGYTYQTDEHGRTQSVTGELKLEEGTRSPLQTEIGHEGLEDDEGGHLIGNRFNGPSDAFNLVPQNMNLNRGEWKAMENGWAEALEQGKNVKVTVEPIYEGDSKRPVSFDVLTEIDDEVTYTSFQNQASSNAKKEAANA